MESVLKKMMVNKAENFANEKDDGSAGNDNHPIDKGERSDIEQVAANTDNENLPDENQRDDAQERLATPEIESGFARIEGASVEHVPELEHHKYGEENTELEN